MVSTEELERLLRQRGVYEYLFDADRADHELRGMAPILARELVAARKVVKAARMVESDDWGTVKYTDDGMWNDAVLLQLALAEYDAATGE